MNTLEIMICLTIFMAVILDAGSAFFRNITLSLASSLLSVASMVMAIKFLNENQLLYVLGLTVCPINAIASAYQAMRLFKSIRKAG